MPSARNADTVASQEEAFDNCCFGQLQREAYPIIASQEVSESALRDFEVAIADVEGYFSTHFVLLSLVNKHRGLVKKAAKMAVRT